MVSQHCLSGEETVGGGAVTLKLEAKKEQRSMKVKSKCLNNMLSSIVAKFSNSWFFRRDRRPLLLPFSSTVAKVNVCIIPLGILSGFKMAAVRSCESQGLSDAKNLN